MEQLGWAFVQQHNAPNGKLLVCDLADLSIAPKLFEGVELALVFQENVGNHANVIEQDPFLVQAAFALPRVFLGNFLYFFFHRTGNGIELGI